MSCMGTRVSKRFGDSDAVEGGVAVDEADAAVAKGAGWAHGVARESAGDDVGLAGGEEMAVVELGVDGAGVAEGDLVDAILEEVSTVDPDVETFVAVALSRAFGHIGGIDGDVETS